MYWTPLSAEAVLLGALLQNVNAMVPRYQAAREEYVQAMPTATADLLGLQEELRNIQDLGLKHRQAETTSSVTYTITMSPDKTCGYLSGSAGVGITCENGATCAWEVKEVDAILCGTAILNRCIESSVAVDPDQCDDVCQSNEFNLLCTDSDTPYCRTYAFPSGVRDYRCASTPVTAVQSADFTYDGQDDPGFVTSVLDDTVTTAISSDTETSTEPVSTTTTTDPPGPTTTVPAPDPPKKKTPIGAIVGGAVGGVAVIAIIVIAAIYFFRKKKKPTEPPVNQTPVVQAPVQGNPGYFPPVPMDQQQHQQMQQMQMNNAPDMKNAMATSPVQSDWRQSSMSGQNSAISPISQAGWGHSQSFQTPSPVPVPAPAPAYEAPGHEARERDPVYEMGGEDTPRK